MIQNIELYTADGKLVETVRDPIVGMMGATGKPPEVMVWGERVFVLAPLDGYRPGTIRYREGMAWALHLGQEATAMPSPRVGGVLAGKTMLPVSTGVPDPRAETSDSDMPGAEKMTESYKPPEDETAGQHLARLGTDAQTWTSDFAYRFPGSIAGMGMGRRADYGTMLGWFANAIETGRTAGHSQGHVAAPDETPWAVNQILEGAPESWDDDAAPDHVAVEYVKELERRLDAAKISREKYMETAWGSGVRYAALAKILADLDRCMHGRHRADSCFDCPDGRSAGNHHLPVAGAVVGYDYAARPYAVPAEGRSFSDPEAWRS